MTYDIMIALLARHCGVQRTRAHAALDDLFSEIADSIAAGEPTRLKGIGTLSIVATGARAGRNVRTGETIRVPAGRRVRIAPAGAMRARLRAGT